jgi:hypothetical protein
MVSGTGVSSELALLDVRPRWVDSYADQPTADLPLFYIWLPTNLRSVNVSNKGAVIMRREGNFSDKIANVAVSGAAFTIYFQ